MFELCSERECKCPDCYMMDVYRVITGPIKMCVRGRRWSVQMNNVIASWSID